MKLTDCLDSEEKSIISLAADTIDGKLLLSAVANLIRETKSINEATRLIESVSDIHGLYKRIDILDAKKIRRLPR